MEKQNDSDPLDAERPAFQLPAYSETDEDTNAGPESPSQRTHLTAEQEKAYLAGREEQHLTTPTPSNIQQQQPSGRDTSTHILSRGLQVPSFRGKVSSGFPYPDVLGTYGVSAQEWSKLTSEIAQAAKLRSKDWTITVGASLATFCATGVFLGWLGLIPAFVVGHRLRRSKEKKNLRAARDAGDLETKLLELNETSFAPKGFLIRLDLPGDQSSDLDQMDVYAPKKWGRTCGGGCHTNATSCRSEAKRAEKVDKRAARSRRKTAKRGRIVIVPIDSVNLYRTEPSASYGEAVERTLLPVGEKEGRTGTVCEV